MSLARPSHTRTISHLLLTGHNPFSPPASTQTSAPSSSSSYRQSPSNPSLSAVPFNTWLSQIGREVDTYHSTSPLITSISSSTGHSLISYKNYQGVDRIIGLGRNESGQLGIGFCSQEGTRGLVEGFEGEGVVSVKTGVQSSYLLVKEDDSRNKLYSIGNLSRGKLSHPNLYTRQPSASSAIPSELDEQQEQDEEPVARLLPRATLVESSALEEFGKIIQIESGYEHLLVLTETGDLFGTGCNTDGQLGLGQANDQYCLVRITIPQEIKDKEGGIEKIIAGGDTSGFITKSGKLYTWGNSEYAQAGHGRKIDQIVSPLLVNARQTFLAQDSRRIVDYRCGGSFGLILDDRNNVYTTGYGALGLGQSPLSSSSSPRSPLTHPNSSPNSPLYAMTPTLVPSLSSSALGFSSPITRIRAAFGYAVAISDPKPSSSSRTGGGGSRQGGHLWSWGLNNQFGRLGLGTISRRQDTHYNNKSGLGHGEGGGADRAMRVEPFVVEPREIELPLSELGLDRGCEEGHSWEIGSVELGDEGMWVELREERRND